MPKFFLKNDSISCLSIRNTSVGFNEISDVERGFSLRRQSISPIK